ncbi:hypothetical protein [Glycomyces buryatensis]|uniref:Lipoprotein n=1 Tax=Glycomyces buryatensis TaxID=2570927 RepID=A0A4S8Q3B6_9ACTN|nr:hypothetical protein [Glycomyces buryatensis]THV38707.1 hypothetical protein FAB82_19975 [Glycomyces buryatensis]
MRYEPEPELVRRRRARSAAAVGAAAILALSACGSDDSDASADAEDTAAIGTSPEEPLAADAMVEVYGWEVTVSDIQLDATEEILDNAGYVAVEPDAGNQLALVTIEGTYVGDDEENNLPYDLLVGFWINGVAYVECPTFPPGYYHDGPVDSGQTVSSAWCVEIPSGITDEALLSVRDPEPWINNITHYFAIE